MNGNILIAIVGFEAELDGRIVTGVSKEKTKAAEEYFQAVSDGRTAYLMDEELADLFTIKYKKSFFSNIKDVNQWIYS